MRCITETYGRRFADDLSVDHCLHRVTRLRLTIKSVEPVEGGVRTTSSGTMELEASDRPVLVAETIGVTYD